MDRRGIFSPTVSRRNNKVCMNINICHYKMNYIPYVIMQPCFWMFSVVKEVSSKNINWFSMCTCRLVGGFVKRYYVALSKCQHEGIVVYSVFGQLSAWFDQCSSYNRFENRRQGYSDVIREFLVNVVLIFIIVCMANKELLQLK